MFEPEKYLLKLNVNNPAHNLVLMYKQCRLMELHLSQKGSNCGTCLKKHILTIEALIDEYVQLACTNHSHYKYMTITLLNYKILYNHFKLYLKELDNVKYLITVRAFRKNIEPEVNILKFT